MQISHFKNHLKDSYLTAWGPPPQTEHRNPVLIKHQIYFLVPKEPSTQRRWPDEWGDRFTSKRPHLLDNIVSSSSAGLPNPPACFMKSWETDCNTADKPNLCLALSPREGRENASGKTAFWLKITKNKKKKWFFFPF